MNSMSIITKATVERLLEQYKEYMVLDTEIERVKSLYQKRLVEIATEQNRSLDVLLQDTSFKDERLELHLQQRYQFERMRDRLSDEMTFPSPEVWMRYKALAYKGTSSEIATWGDFVQHCSPKGYICTNRFMFLRNELRSSYQTELDDLDRGVSLLEMCEADWLKQLQEDPAFIEKWQSYEFFIRDNKIAKWENLA